MKFAGRIACACVVMAVLVPPRPARADGGLVRVSRRSGPYVVTVFTTPTPLRVGRADISVLVQTAETDRVVTDAETTVRLRMAETGGAGPRRAKHVGNVPHGPYPATRGQATNKLLKAAIVEFPSPGSWTVEVDVKGAEGSSHVEFTAEVRAAPPRWFDLLPWIAWPGLAIALFVFREAAVHSRRRRREQRRRSSAGSPGDAS